MTCGCQKPYVCLLHAVRIENLSAFVLAAEKLAEAAEKILFTLGGVEGYLLPAGKPKTDALRAALLAWKEAGK
jgi:hypothetical protein